MARTLLQRFSITASLLTALLLSPAVLADSPESALVARARELVDTYYGGRNLQVAAALLAEAHASKPNDSNLYVQAARITIKGGHLKFDTFEEGTFERYSALLDKALAIDPSNAKAHILRAEAYGQQNRKTEQLAELDKAKALKTDDPWLQVGYGSYFQSIRDTQASYGAFSSVVERGPGTTHSQRRAYVAALSELSRIVRRGEPIEENLRKYAKLAVSARHPEDAWTPLGYAEDFIDFLMLEDAIAYARIALKTMDFGAGRLTLAASLYARAAQLQMAGRPRSEFEPLLSEARTFGFSKSSLLEYLLERRGYKDNTRSLEPALRKLIP